MRVEHVSLSDSDAPDLGLEAQYGNDTLSGADADSNDEVEQSVDAITALIEPLIMVLLGGIIGFVLIAMYMPIFTMADNLAPH